MADVLLVAGLGNPEGRYGDTRHNAGFWFVDAVADSFGARFAAKKSLGARMTKVATTGGQMPNTDARMANPGGDAEHSGAHSVTSSGFVRLLKPDSYMNESGAAVVAAARYFDIKPQEILIAHDEADLPPGAAKLKRGGGEAGHRGLLDISRALASRDYWRLRLGVGKGAGGAGEHVLRRPPKAERDLINNAIHRAAQLWREITGGRMERAMMILHSEAD